MSATNTLRFRVGVFIALPQRIDGEIDIDGMDHLQWPGEGTDPPAVPGTRTVA